MEILNNLETVADRSRVRTLLRCGEGAKAEIGELIDSETAACLPLIRPLIVLEKVEITEKKKDCVILENGAVFHGSYIAGKLSRCRYVMVCLCTLGKEIGDYIGDLFKKEKMLKALAADGIAAAALEALGGRLWGILADRIRGTAYGMTMRLSPGDSGWDVSEQTELFRCFPQNGMPVCLNKNSIMVPFKTVSAVYGFGEGIGLSRADHICGECSLTHCAYRRENTFELTVHRGESTTVVTAASGDSLLTVLQKKALPADSHAVATAENAE